MVKEKGDTKTLRTIAILQCLTSRRPLTTNDVWARMQQLGFDTSKRTIERDLESLALSLIFGSQLVCKDDSKPYGWLLNSDAQWFLPALDFDLAGSWDLVGHCLEHFIPHEAQNKLAPQIDRARKYLKDHGQGGWSKKVAFLPRSFLKPAKVRPAVKEAVYDAIVGGTQLLANYRNTHGEEKEAVLHIQGIVHRVTVSYVVAMWNDYQDIRHLALHRITKAHVLNEPARKKVDFSLYEYIESQAFDLAIGGICRLRLRFYNSAGNHLKETPLAEPQTITEIDDTTLECEVELQDTQELRWWILSFGGYVEVLEPASIRKAIAAQLATAAGRYNQ